MTDPFLGVAATLAKEVNRTLDGTAVITRTGATLACRVDQDMRQIRLPQLPRIVELLRWRLTFRDSQDVQAGDVATVTAPDPDPLSPTFRQVVPLGTYGVMEVTNPATYSVSTDCFAVRQRKADGSLDMLTNQTATFVSKTAPGQTAAKLTNKPVLIWAQSPQERAEALGVGLDFDWNIAFDPQFTFAWGEVRDGVQVRWAGPRATAAETTAGGKLYTLKEVDVHFNPFPLITAVFSETR